MLPGNGEPELEPPLHAVNERTPATNTPRNEPQCSKVIARAFPSRETTSRCARPRRTPLPFWQNHKFRSSRRGRCRNSSPSGDVLSKVNRCACVAEIESES